MKMQAERFGHGHARMRWLLSGVAILLLVSVLVWASDSITLQDERTVFTVDCNGGWKDNHCSGTLAPGGRYKFHVSRTSGQVLFWKVGTAEPMGSLAPCDITDGRNWTCPPGPDALRSITLQMSDGRPVTQPGAPTQPCHAVAKWQWWLLRAGIRLGRDAK